MSAYRSGSLAIAVLLSACAASGDKRPDWVDGTSSRHPSAQYLVGRGQAASAEQAQDRARADLAKGFEVAVRAESQDTQRFETGAGTQTQVTRVTATATDQVIQGIQIAERWRDETTDTHHALAVLARGPAVQRLREEIERLDAATRSYIEQAKNQSDPLAQIGAASRALAMSIERANVQKSLRVVDITGRGMEPEWSSTRLAADLDALLKRLHIATRTTGEPNPAFATALAAGVAAAGFSPATDATGNYLLEGDLALTESEQEGWHWSRGTLSVHVTDSAGRVRGNQRWNIKAAGQSAAQARERALEQAAGILKKELRGALVGFATQ